MISWTASYLAGELQALCEACGPKWMTLADKSTARIYNVLPSVRVVS